jgi:hypothetical protein
MVFSAIGADHVGVEGDGHGDHLEKLLGVRGGAADTVAIPPEARLPAPPALLPNYGRSFWVGGRLHVDNMVRPGFVMIQ